MSRRATGSSRAENLFNFYSKEIAAAGAEYATEMRNGGKAGPDTGSALRLKNLGVPTATITQHRGGAESAPEHRLYVTA